MTGLLLLETPKDPSSNPSRPSVALRRNMGRQIHDLNSEVMRMGVLSREMLAKAVDALDRQDPALAEEVERMDDEIDAIDREVQRRGISLIALQHPMAADLRMVTAVLRAAVDLERIGDYAVEIARYGRFVRPFHPAPLHPLLREMAAQVDAMIQHTVDAFVERDLEGVNRVCSDDEPDVDRSYRGVLRALIEAMRSRPEELEIDVYQLLAARSLERIGDHCTNVAEWTQYTVSGVFEELA